MKNSQQKLPVLIVFGLLLILVGGWLYFHYFFDLLGECHEQLTEEKLSPERNYLARELLLGCGATSDFGTQIHIKNENTGNEQTVLSIKGDHTQTCGIRWADKTTLQVACSEKSELVYQKKSVFEIVTIMYAGTD